MLKSIIIIISIFFLACSNKELIKKNSPPEKVYSSQYNPKASALFINGLKYKTKQEWKQAIVFFQQAYLVENSPFILKEISKCHFKLNEFLDAVQTSKIALEELPDDLEMLEILMNSSIRIGEETIFEETLIKLISITPDNIIYSYTLIDFYFQKKEFEKMIPIIDSIIDGPINERAAYNLKIKKLLGLYNTNNYQEIIEIMNGDYQDFKDTREGLELLINSYFQTGKIEKAYENQIEMLNLTLDTVEEYYKLIYISQMTNLDSLQLKSYDIAIAKFPNNLDFRSEKSEFLFKSQKYDLAENVLFEIEEVDSLGARVYDILGELNRRYGRFDRCLQLYEAGYTKYPDSENILNNYAYILSEEGLELDKALDMSIKALEKNPESANYLDTIAWIYYKLDDYEKAYSYINEAIIKSGNKPNHEIYLHAHEICLKLNYMQEAKNYLREAYNLSKDDDLLDKLEEMK
ncbi:MAG: hypothetical protein JXR48_10320 [Candidatus Delongbacteria bacterium]|nr:hypothetical protein [Candidatus Delongbacteria bacterium]MBN2835350.1 hypothetical protein [Candidatus Delongbacteria bacterium]